VPGPVITKTRYVQGLQCPKLLWHLYNAREMFPPVDVRTQAIFDQGHEVGLLAQELFAGGTLVEEGGLDEAAARTRELLLKRVPLFEAAFRFGQAAARADVLEPVGRDGWNIVEVKSATTVSDPYWDDLAIQRHCYEGAGLEIRGCFILHVNNAYVRQGPVNPRRFFTRVDVTPAVEKKRIGIGRRIGRMVRVVESARSPEVEIGPQCSSPYPCPLIPMCWKGVHDTPNSVFLLSRLGARAWKLYRQGVRTTDRIPADFRLSRAQKIQVRAEAGGRPYVNAIAVRKFLSSLRYPVHYLDFETFAAAIPRLDGRRPYQQVPFQFSLHVAQEPLGELQHHSWIWDGHGDAGRILLEQLEPLIGAVGSIVAYAAAFEKGRLTECAQANPQFAQWVDGILERMVDLLAPFQSFSVYFPDQAGSASMKRVLPALTGRSYKDLAIHEGGQASTEFMRITFGEASEEERRRIRAELEEYCGLDTRGMAEIVGALGGLAAPAIAGSSRGARTRSGVRRSGSSPTGPAGGTPGTPTR
jgi:hypothetical protein